jgi:hypothetical protein
MIGRIGTWQRRDVRLHHYFKFSPSVNQYHSAIRFEDMFFLHSSCQLVGCNLVAYRPQHQRTCIPVYHQVRRRAPYSSSPHRRCDFHGDQKYVTVYCCPRTLLSALIWQFATVYGDALVPHSAQPPHHTLFLVSTLSKDWRWTEAGTKFVF